MHSYVNALSARRRLLAAAPHFEGLADIFKVLADPTRLRVLATLLDGEHCVHEICDRVGASQPAVSHQLRVLRDARLVRCQRVGREINYALDDEHVLLLLCEGLDHAGHGPASAKPLPRTR